MGKRATNLKTNLCLANGNGDQPKLAATSAALARPHGCRPDGLPVSPRGELWESAETPSGSETVLDQCHVGAGSTGRWAKRSRKCRDAGLEAELAGDPPGDGRPRFLAPRGGRTGSA